MSWLERIKVADGLDENDTERIVSHISGDSFIQLSGFFSLCEIQSLYDYLKQPELPCHCERCQPCHQPC